MNQLDFVIASDFKLLNILLGISGHGSKYACIYCEGPKGLDCGQLRTFGRIQECYTGFEEAGCDKKKMKEFGNVVHPPLICAERDQTILETVPPPELHMLMGATNHLLELIRRFLESRNLEGKLWEWCNSHGITWRGDSPILYHYYFMIFNFIGYNGTNKLDGNNANRFLYKIQELENCDWFPIELNPVVDVMWAFKEIKDKTFGWTCEEGWALQLTPHCDI